MPGAVVARAKAWFTQAESDARTAKALRTRPAPMIEQDVGCHVAALCAQAVEKSIKGYVILNRQTPAMNHRADKYLGRLLGARPLLHYADHRGPLSELFTVTVRATVKQLLDLTPGTLDKKDVPNTEYPWPDNDDRQEIPAGAREFADADRLDAWVKVASRVSAELHKLGIAVDRGL